MIMRDVNNGWAVRYTHANVASFFFIFVYAQYFKPYFNLLNTKNLYYLIYNNYLIGVGLQLGYIISKVLDRGVIEVVGPYGLSNVLSNTGFNISKLDTGVITTYSLYITLALLSLLFLVFAPILLETSIFNWLGSEIRLFIIYLAALCFALSPLLP